MVVASAGNPFDQGVRYYREQAERLERFADRIALNRMSARFRELAAECRRQARNSRLP